MEFLKYLKFRFGDCLNIKCKLLFLFKVVSIYKEWKAFKELLKVYGFYDKYCAWIKCNRYYINMPVFRQVLKFWLDEKATDYPLMLKQLFVLRS